MFFPNLASLTGKTVVMGLSLLGTCGVVFWSAYKELRPDPQEMSPKRRKMMENVTEDLINRIPFESETIRRMAVAPLAGDVTGEATQHIRKVLAGSGLFDVPPPPLGERVRGLFSSEWRDLNTREEALEYGRKAEAELVLWGRVDRLYEREGKVEYDITLEIYDMASEEAPPIWSENANGDQEEVEGAGGGFFLSIRALAVRIFFCLLFFLFFSIVLMPVIRSTLDRESNEATLLLLTAMTAVDAALAFFLVHDVSGRYFTIALVVGLAVAAGWYNYWFCSRLEAVR
jgi:hypothetical protein